MTVDHPLGWRTIGGGSGWSCALPVEVSVWNRGQGRAVPDTHWQRLHEPSNGMAASAGWCGALLQRQGCLKICELPT